MPRPATVSDARVVPLQARGRWFEPSCAHACQSRYFDSDIDHRGLGPGANPAWRVGAHGGAAAALCDCGAPLTAQARHIERAAEPGDLAAVSLLAEAASTVQAQAPGTAAQRLCAALRLFPESAGPHAALVFDEDGAVQGVVPVRQPGGTPRHQAPARQGVLDQIAHLGGGLAEAISEVTTGREPQGRFLFSATVGLFEQHGFTRVRKVDKHAWIVSTVIEPA
jgi:hypothetical protein